MRLNLNNADKVAFNGSNVNNVAFNGRPVWRDTGVAATEAAKYLHYTNGLKRKFVKIAIYGESSQTETPSQENPAAVVNTVNPVIRIMGKNVLNIYGFSATMLETPTSARNLKNNYGTVIDTVNKVPPENPVLTVTQSTAPNTSAPINYNNGFVVIGAGNMVAGRKYSFSFNIDITNKLLKETNMFSLLVNGVNNYLTEVKQGVNKIVFTGRDYMQRKFVELRCSGMSFVIKDMIFCEADVENTEFEPYCEQTVTLPYTLRAVPSSAGGFTARDSVEMRDGKVLYIKRVSEELDNCTAQSITDKNEYILPQPVVQDITNTDTGVAILSLYSDKINTVMSDADISLTYAKQ